MSYDYQIESYLKSKVPHFLGCFASDELPKNPPYGSSLIVNYSKRDTAGTHWVAIHGLETNKVTFFDSYGFRPDAEDIILSVHTNFTAYLKNHSTNNTYTYNELNLQDVESDVCGEYACKFLKDGLPMSRTGVINKKWEKYVKSNDTHRNDKWIKQEIMLRNIK